MSESPYSVSGLESLPTLPFEGDIRLRTLDAPVDNEPPRDGEDPATCQACQAPDQEYVWVGENWRVRTTPKPSGLPMVLALECRSHLGLGDLSDQLANELGLLTVRLERAIRSLDGVARVQVTQWGDGTPHLQYWFHSRPYGQLQLRGQFLPLWDEVLTRGDETTWRENLALVAAWLAEFGGEAIAEPPRIDWQAPAQFSLPDQSAASATDGAKPTVPADTASAKTASANGTEVAVVAGRMYAVDTSSATPAASAVAADDSGGTTPVVVQRSASD